MAIIINLFLLMASLYFLAVVVDEYFIDSLDKISKKLKLSHEVAGATLMAMGSSAPELFTSLIASLKGAGHGDIGTGTIVGSAIFNILVIIGASAMFRRAKLTWQPVIRDLFFYCIAIIALLISFSDGMITLIEASSFVLLYGVYIFSVTNWSRWLKYTPVVFEEDIVEKKIQTNFLSKLTSGFFKFVLPDTDKRYGRVFLISILFIGALSYILVESAVSLATILNINPVIIGLTVLAAGTSIPDLMASVIVARKGRGDMAIANGVGSNIFDILFALGIPWIIVILLKGENVVVGTENLSSSVFLLFATVVAVFFVLALKKWEIGKRAGILLIFLYICYILYNVVQIL